MKQIEIHLSEPFAEVLATLLRLPSTGTETEEIRSRGTGDSAVRGNDKCDREVTEAFRSLYEAANGRQVETQIGFIAIAPPVAGFLKEKPYYVATQYEFFVEAFARILSGESPGQERTNGAWTRGGKLLARRRRSDLPHEHARRGNATTLLRSRATRFANSQH